MMHQSWGSQDSWNKKQTTQSAELLRNTGMRTGLQGGRQRTFPLSLIRDSDRDGVGVRKRQRRQVAAEGEAYNRMYTVGTGRERQEWAPGDNQTISFHCCFLIRKAEKKLVLCQFTWLLFLSCFAVPCLYLSTPTAYGSPLPSVWENRGFRKSSIDSLLIRRC